MGVDGLRTALGVLLGMPPRAVTGLVGRNRFAPAVAVETYSDAPISRDTLVEQSSVAKTLAAWAMLFGIDEWWDQIRDRADPLWRRLSG
jgi:hypothetical protein